MVDDFRKLAGTMGPGRHSERLGELQVAVGLEGGRPQPGSGPGPVG